MTRLLAELERGHATAYDLADATGMSTDSCRAQLSELRRMGVVTCIGQVPREVTVMRKVGLYALPTNGATHES
jgi:hypothetical protein